MARMTQWLFVEKKLRTFNKQRKRQWKSWFLVKPHESRGLIRIGDIEFPEHYVGRRVRLKIVPIPEQRAKYDD
jgi:hypothetical protein